MDGAVVAFIAVNSFLLGFVVALLMVGWILSRPQTPVDPRSEHEKCQDELSEWLWRGSKMP